MSGQNNFLLPDTVTIGMLILRKIVLSGFYELLGTYTMCIACAFDCVHNQMHKQLHGLLPSIVVHVQYVLWIVSIPMTESEIVLTTHWSYSLRSVSCCMEVLSATATIDLSSWQLTLETRCELCFVQA